jgi:hypothetical protein
MHSRYNSLAIPHKKIIHNEIEQGTGSTTLAKEHACQNVRRAIQLSTTNSRFPTQRHELHSSLRSSHAPATRLLRLSGGALTAENSLMIHIEGVALRLIATAFSNFTPEAAVMCVLLLCMPVLAAISGKRTHAVAAGCLAVAAKV